MHPPRNRHLRAAVEVGFIIFLFYSNLLMGEFTATAGRGKTLPAAIANIVTLQNLAIAVAASVLGHLGFEVLRKKS
jgi:uncharacterized protein with PQ loop repeat